MTRSIDLDTIAPDDEVVISKPVKKSAKKHIKTKTVIKEDQKVQEACKGNEECIEKVYSILGHTKSPFSSFLVRPKILNFAEKDDDEEIYLAVRPHWVTNIGWFTISVIMFFIPVFFKYFTFLNIFPTQYQFALVLFWYLLTFIYAFEKFLSWYFDLFMVTSQRLVDISFNNLLNKHFAEADLSAIQDVSSSIKGILGTFFNYGNVLIQTASEVNQITFENVSNPEKIIKLLKELRDLEEEKKGGIKA